MESHSFNSTNISFGTYNDEDSELTVTFNSGRTYRYHNVPPTVWTDFKQASSAGKFFNENIKFTFDYEEV